MSGLTERVKPRNNRCGKIGLLHACICEPPWADAVPPNFVKNHKGRTSHSKQLPLTHSGLTKSVSACPKSPSTAFINFAALKINVTYHERGEKKLLRSKHGASIQGLMPFLCALQKGRMKSTVELPPLSWWSTQTLLFDHIKFLNGALDELLATVTKMDQLVKCI